ncbi:eukaryotic translation initiation factor 2B delta subunit [Crepidotus variabilis]|uniref:Translation initiation factor eIF2B subunit delta n=1 Tax=Crepidotus variabilis TaxID=179855 RepID=A0A9P6JWE9_9AGAR|nr:eukaryotic translation initiation factor 2B delta subunit [Crepidotus variabilis]
MPVPTIADPPVVVQSGAKPSQQSMSKAERRELQEKQRAAKAALKEQQGGGKPQGGKAPAGAQPKPPQTPKAPKDQQAGPPQAKIPQATGGAGPSKTKIPTTPHRKSFLAESPWKGGLKDASAAAAEEASNRQSHGLRIFTHFGQPKPIIAVKGEIHPAIVRLGLLFSEFKICGANARCIATLTAFKQVIQDYTTPPQHTLSRHLMTHLSPQITHLVSARPMSVTMGNAIRELKLKISNIDIDMVEQDAKNALYAEIDNYIRDRILLADELIEELAGNKIKDGDVILTYAKSSVVEKVLLNAREEGKKFSIIVIDSPPLLEGKVLLQSLIQGSNPIPCTYALLPALPSLLTDVSMVLVGAHALYSNGAVYSRAGTAMVAMMAKANSVPVVVCCETYKFSEGVMVDGFSKNELVPLSISNKHSNLLKDIDAEPNLEKLNPLYDLTPPGYITAVVTEVGLIPPSSISSIPLALGKTNM